MWLLFPQCDGQTDRRTDGHNKGSMDSVLHLPRIIIIIIKLIFDATNNNNNNNNNNNSNK